MAYSITSACVNCWACQPLCPTAAITPGLTQFAIQPTQCVECEGYFDLPQCSEVCPVEEAIVDGRGAPVNPLGSLTQMAGCG